VRDTGVSLGARYGRLPCMHMPGLPLKALHDTDGPAGRYVLRAWAIAFLPALPIGALVAATFGSIHEKILFSVVFLAWEPVSRAKAYALTAAVHAAYNAWPAVLVCLLH
jgi:hypothetical protein